MASKSTQTLLAKIKGDLPDGRIEELIEEADDDCDLEAVMEAIDEYRPGLRQRLIGKAALNI